MNVRIPRLPRALHFKAQPRFVQQFSGLGVALVESQLYFHLPAPVGAGPSMRKPILRVLSGSRVGSLVRTASTAGERGS